MYSLIYAQLWVSSAGIKVATTTTQSRDVRSRRAVGLHSPTLAWMRTSAALGGLTSGRSLPRPEESLALRCGREAPPSPNSTPSSNCQYATRSLCHGQIEKSPTSTTSNNIDLTEYLAVLKAALCGTHTQHAQNEMSGGESDSRVVLEAAGAPHPLQDVLLRARLCPDAHLLVVQ